LWLAESPSLKVPTHSINDFMRLFSKRPIREEVRASLASDGTLATVAFDPELCCT
jgi:hypothetical protein